MTKKQKTTSITLDNAINSCDQVTISLLHVHPMVLAPRIHILYIHTPTQSATPKDHMQYHWQTAHLQQTATTQKWHGQSPCVHIPTDWHTWRARILMEKACTNSQWWKGASQYTITILNIWTDHHTSGYTAAVNGRTKFINYQLIESIRSCNLPSTYFCICVSTLFANNR